MADDTGAAVRSARRLDERSLSALAEQRGMTLEGLWNHLDSLELQAADNGDLTSARNLRGRISVVLLGRVMRRGSSKSVYRGIAQLASAGAFANVREVTEALKAVSLRKEMEVADQDRDIRELENVVTSVLTREAVNGQ